MQHILLVITFLRSSENPVKNELQPQVNESKEEAITTELNNFSLSNTANGKKIKTPATDECDKHDEEESEALSNQTSECKNVNIINDIILKLFFSETSLIDGPFKDHKRYLTYRLQKYKDTLLDDNDGEVNSFKVLIKIDYDDLFLIRNAKIRKEKKEEFDRLVDNCNEAQKELLASSISFIEYLISFANKIITNGPSKRCCGPGYIDEYADYKSKKDDYHCYACLVADLNCECGLGQDGYVRDSFLLIQDNLINNDKFVELLDKKLERLLKICTKADRVGFY